jgi:hypothetical protein
MSHARLRVLTATVGAIVLSALPTAPLAASGDAADVSYTSRPDEVAVFLNGIAYARDELSLPGGVEARVILPDTVFTDTLILRQDGERVSPYRVDRGSGQLAVEWQSDPGEAVREVTLEYLLGGVGWSPRYDLWLGADEDTGPETRVDLDALAEIANGALSMDDVVTQLVVGEVDPAMAVDAVAQISANQYIAGYEEPAAIAAAPTGAVDIQHVYDVGRLTADPGEVVSLRLFGGDLPARRLHLWNAQTDDRVSVIYKVRNDGPAPFAEGIVRSYQDGLFIGSDTLELTPVGSEGSVTVGTLPDVRASRAESSTALGGEEFRYRNEVQLTVSNFGSEPVALEIVDQLAPEAQELTASLEPERTAGNLLRWQVTIGPSATLVISYDFKIE